MLGRVLQTAKPTMQQLVSNNRAYNSAIHYLPCMLDMVQQQQQVKVCVPHNSLKSDQYKKEHEEIVCNLKSYAHMLHTMHGHLLPISLDKYCNLILPPNVYNSQYLPQSMAPPTSSPKRCNWPELTTTHQWCKHQPPDVLLKASQWADLRPSVESMTTNLIGIKGPINLHRLTGQQVCVMRRIWTNTKLT